MAVAPTADELLTLLTSKARIPLAEVAEFPHGAVFEEPSSVVLPKMDGWEARLDLANDLMMRDLRELMLDGDLAVGRRPVPVPPRRPGMNPLQLGA
jgi:hypothetical protein